MSAWAAGTISKLLLIDRGQARRTQGGAPKIFKRGPTWSSSACLTPAAKEAVTLIDNPKTRVIDASTAHRTAEGWVYGFAELLPGQRQRIKFAAGWPTRRRTPPAFCPPPAPWPSWGYCPGTIPSPASLSRLLAGGGKKMIAEYEAPDRSPLLDAPSLYSIGLAHKHLPESAEAGRGWDSAPVFVAHPGDIRQGMMTSVMLQT